MVASHRAPQCFKNGRHPLCVGMAACRGPPVPLTPGATWQLRMLMQTPPPAPAPPSRTRARAERAKLSAVRLTCSVGEARQGAQPPTSVCGRGAGGDRRGAQRPTNDQASKSQAQGFADAGRGRRTTQTHLPNSLPSIFLFTVVVQRCCDPEGRGGCAELQGIVCFRVPWGGEWAQHSRVQQLQTLYFEPVSHLSVRETSLEAPSFAPTPGVSTDRAQHPHAPGAPAAGAGLQTLHPPVSWWRCQEALHLEKRPACAPAGGPLRVRCVGPRSQALRALRGRRRRSAVHGPL